MQILNQNAYCGTVEKAVGGDFRNDEWTDVELETLPDDVVLRFFYLMRYCQYIRARFDIQWFAGPLEWLDGRYMKVGRVTYEYNLRDRERAQDRYKTEELEGERLAVGPSLLKIRNTLITGSVAVPAVWSDHMPISALYALVKAHAEALKEHSQEVSPA